MEAQTIIQLITSVGFPIVACCAMGFYVKYITDRNSAQIDTISAAHRSEMSEVTEAIHNNTLAIQKLTDYLTLKGGE